jgi:hypothetical protein
MLGFNRRQLAIFGMVLAAAVAAPAQQSAVRPQDAQNASAKQEAKPAAEEHTFKRYLADTVGPYPLAMAVFTAAIHQGTDNPPEWHQGFSALSKRFGSNMGITAVGNTTRYGLATLLDVDTSYHRCQCAGVPRRVAHAAFSALIARKRSGGKSVFSVPGLAAPYAATMTATYAWYPSRYGARDALRMGNYNLLGTVGSNIAFEFIPRKVWKGLEHIHMSSRRVADEN